MLERAIRSRPVRTVMTYLDSQASAYAAGLAFNTLLAMFPLVLGIMAIVGMVTGDPTTQHSVQQTVAGVFPDSARVEIVTGLESVRRSAGLLGVISLLGLLWTGTNLFASMEFALAQVYGSRQRDPVRQRLMGVIMLIVFLAAIGVDIAANALIGLLPSLPYAGFAIGAAAMVGLLIAVYRMVPNRTFGLAAIWPGALLAGVLIEVFTLIFPLYAQLSHGFNTYGQGFALFFVLAIWVLFLCQIILAGAIFIRVGAGDPDRGGLLGTKPAEGRALAKPDEVVAAEAHSHD